MATVIGMASVGGAYRGGRRVPGWTEARLDDGRSIFGPENVNILALAREQGHDTTGIESRLDIWVKTGVMPPRQ